LKRKLPGWVLAILALPCACQAKTLFSFTTSQGGSEAGTVSSLTFPTQYGGNPTYLTNSIFATEPFTTADVGKVVTISRADDPNFNSFVTELTDGLDETIYFWFVPAPAFNIGGQGWDETLVVWGRSNDPRIDLSGQTVRFLSMQLDSFTATNQNGSSSFNASITFSGSDTIPEPASGTLIALLAVGLLGRRRRKLPGDVGLQAS
jgi:hypothetical protein